MGPRKFSEHVAETRAVMRLSERWISRAVPVRVTGQGSQLSQAQCPSAFLDSLSNLLSLYFHRSSGTRFQPWL